MLHIVVSIRVCGCVVFNFGTYLFYSWAYEWFPVWGSYKQCCYEHSYECLLLNLRPHLFAVYLRAELMSHMFSFRRYCQIVFQSVPPLPALRENSSFSAFFPTLDTVCLSCQPLWQVCSSDACGSSLTLFLYEIIPVFPSSSDAHLL